MPIDPSIALQVKPAQIESPLDSLARVLQVKNAMAQQQLIPGQIQAQQQQLQAGQQQIQATQLENQTRQNALDEYNGFKAALQKNGGDFDATLKNNAGDFPTLAPKLQESRVTINKTLADTAKLKADADDATHKLAVAKLTEVDQALQGLNAVAPEDREAAFQATKARLDATGHDTSSLGPVYDPQVVAGVHAQITSTQQKIEDAKEARDKANSPAAAAKLSAEAADAQLKAAAPIFGAAKSQGDWDAAVKQFPNAAQNFGAIYSPATAGRAARLAVPIEKQPEYDIQTKAAAEMARMTPTDWQNQIDHIAPPKGETAGLNGRTRVLVNSAVARGDYPAAQAAIKDASDQLGRIDVARKNAENKITLDMGSFAGTNGEPSSTAKAVANYQIPSAQAMSRMAPPAREALMRQVLQINPGFQEQNYNTFNATEKDAVTGKIGTQANALNTMMGHLSILDQAAAALKNGDIQAINKIANIVGAQTGGTAQTAYDTIVHRIGPEVTKAYVASGGSVGERGANEEDFSRNLGPDQIKANIGVSAQLADSKIKALQDQYNRGTYGQGKQKLISDEAEQARQRLAGNSPVAGGQTKTVTTKADYDALPSGSVYIDSADGKTYKKR